MIFPSGIAADYSIARDAGAIDLRHSRDSHAAQEPASDSCASIHGCMSARFHVKRTSSTEPIHAHIVLYFGTYQLK